MKDIWNWIQLGITAIGGGLGYFLGGFDGALYTLLAFIMADYVTGIFRAITEKNLSSKIGAQGIVKKIAIVILVGVGNMVDVHLLGGGSALRTAILFFYISNEGISLLENAAAIGLPIPQILRDALSQLHGKAEPEHHEPSEPGDHEYIVPPHPAPVEPKENEQEDDQNESS